MWSLQGNVLTWLLNRSYRKCGCGDKSSIARTLNTAIKEPSLACLVHSLKVEEAFQHPNQTYLLYQMMTSRSSSPLPASSDSGDDDEVRSYFNDITKGCNVFRILVIGKAGSGKSTLVSEVFDFELGEASVDHFSVSILLVVFETTTIADSL